ncbi:unnamed protein product [Umbelopsis ramanniana]
MATPATKTQRWIPQPHERGRSREIAAFIKKAEQDLKVVQRQGAISSMFNSGEKLIIEDQRIVRTAGDN